MESRYQYRQRFKWPTNEVWLFPWLNYLKSNEVRYYHGHKGKEIIYESGQVKGVFVTGLDGITKTITGDVYILATPIERAIKIIPEEMLKHDPSLTGMKALAENTS